LEQRVPPPAQSADQFAVLRPRLQKALVGFARELPKDWHEGHLVTATKPPREEFPVPELVLFAFRNVLGYHTSLYDEKVRWSVYGTFNGVLISFELRKLGFTICAADGASFFADLPLARSWDCRQRKHVMK
jgi:hypothetical protein